MAEGLQGRSTSWAVEPTGQRLLGNDVAPEPAGPLGTARGQAVAKIYSKHTGSRISLTDMLRSDERSPRIVQSEVEVINRSMSEDDSHLWHQLSSQDNVTVSVVAGEPRSGKMTFKAEADLPGVPIELAADQLCLWTQRCKWDPYVVNVEMCDIGPTIEEEVPGNILYFVVRAPPFSDRDMVTQIVTAKTSNGDAYYTYCRSIEHPGYPAERMGRVRAFLCGTVAFVRRDLADPQNSSRMTLITRQDFRLPFVPVWLVNVWAPSKLVDFTQRMVKAAKRRQAELVQGAAFPSRDFFMRTDAREKVHASASGCVQPEVGSKDMAATTSLSKKFGSEASSSNSTEYDTDATTADQEATPKPGCARGSHGATSALLKTRKSPNELQPPQGHAPLEGRQESQPESGPELQKPQPEPAPKAQVSSEPVLEEVPAAHHQPCGLWGACGVSSWER